MALIRVPALFNTFTPICGAYPRAALIQGRCLLIFLLLYAALIEDGV